ncbi:MAG: amino acid ABC transporter permease [Clostridium sp.]|jgi:L-cystine transport system permease protein|nr:amino acid ABC transporter permease [Clostridium sp.]
MIRESFDIEYIKTIIPKLLKAVPLTLELSIASIIFGCLAGLLLAYIKVSGPKALKSSVYGLTTLLKTIPDVVLLYIIYFGLPIFLKSVFGISLDSWQKQTFVIIALSISFAATASEMFRSAYSALEKGQLEAAHALGMTKWQRFARIIYPQGLFVILPNLASACLAITQATALAFTLGIMDITGKSRILDTNAGGLKTFESYLTVALLYWAISFLFNAFFKGLEFKFGKGLRTLATNTR